MTFDEWLSQDEGVVDFGMQLHPGWVDGARAGWKGFAQNLELTDDEIRIACKCELLTWEIQAVRNVLYFIKTRAID